jgi:hypothetical protein
MWRQVVRHIPTFWSTLLLPSSPILKTETSRSSETVSHVYEITRNSIPEGLNVNIHLHEYMIKAGDMNFMYFYYILCFYIPFFQSEHYSPELCGYAVTVHIDGRDICVVRIARRPCGCYCNVIKLYKVRRCILNRHLQKKAELQKRNKSWEGRNGNTCKPCGWVRFSVGTCPNFSHFIRKWDLTQFVPLVPIKNMFRLHAIFTKICIKLSLMLHRAACWSGNALELRRCFIQILAETRTTLTEVLLGFPQSLQRNAKIILLITLRPPPSRSLQFQICKWP